MKWSLSALGFDSYERRARLYPGLIAVLPAIAPLLVLKTQAIFEHYGRALVGSAMYVGLFYLLVNVSRGEGKRIQPSLLKKWGGWPSTIVLRHSDTTIDAYTKARYHAALAKLAPDVSLPSAEEESKDPAGADEAFRSVTNKLLELRRGEKFRLIQDGNAEYGFRRNMLGLKPWSITIAIIAGFVLLFIWWWPFRVSQTSAASALNDFGKRWKLYGLALGDLADLCFWCFYVRERWVRRSGFDFAAALFRTLETKTRQKLT